MIQDLSEAVGGIKIGRSSFNVYCYADDILLTSVTVTGLQGLIDRANAYIVDHGLVFNPLKTRCITFGTSTLNNPKWTLSNEVLT